MVYNYHTGLKVVMRKLANHLQKMIMGQNKNWPLILFHVVFQNHSFRAIARHISGFASRNLQKEIGSFLNIHRSPHEAKIVLPIGCIQ
jgi:hypothetical protein